MQFVLAVRVAAAGFPVRTGVDAKEVMRKGGGRQILVDCGGAVSACPNHGCSQRFPTWSSAVRKDKAHEGAAGWILPGR